MQDEVRLNRCKVEIFELSKLNFVRAPPLPSNQLFGHFQSRRRLIKAKGTKGTSKMIKYFLILASAIIGALAGPSPTNNTMRPGDYPALIFRRPRETTRSGDGRPKNPLECVSDGGKFYKPSCNNEIINEIRYVSSTSGIL